MLVQSLPGDVLGGTRKKSCGFQLHGRILSHAGSESSTMTPLVHVAQEQPVNAMPIIDDVYRKFGEAAEAAQLLETELGTMFLQFRCEDEGLLENKNPARAVDILGCVNRHTLGQLLKGLNNHTQSLDALDYLLTRALGERNRLFHSFYREHNFRRNSDEGRQLMLADLESIHSALFEAYKAVLSLTGVELDKLTGMTLPTRHVRI
jgi:hypothetical protein